MCSLLVFNIFFVLGSVFDIEERFFVVMFVSYDLVFLVRVGLIGLIEAGY